MNSISRFWITNFSSLDTLLEKIKDNGYSSSKNDELNTIFLDKFNKKHPNLNNLLNNDFSEFKDYVLKELSAYNTEDHFKKYYQMNKVEIKSIIENRLLNEEELKHQHTNKFLRRFDIDNTSLLDVQMQYCLDNFKEDKRKHLDYVENILKASSYRTKKEHFLGFKFDKKFRKFVKEEMENKYFSETSMYKFKYFSNIYPNTYYAMYEKLDVSKLDSRTSWDILENYPKPPKDFFQSLIKNINPTSSQSNLKKFVKILEKSDYRGDYLNDILKIKKAISDQESKDIKNTLAILGAIGAVAAASSTSNDNDDLDLTDIAIGIGTGMAVDSFVVDPLIDAASDFFD